MAASQPIEGHVTSLESTKMGVQAACSCGWKGVDHCWMSDDYAFTNARDEAGHHKRSATTVDGLVRRFG